MARQRDYKAEYQKRKARAREQGFESYWLERKAKKSGLVNQPKQRFRNAYQRAGFETPDEYRKMQAANRKWSKEHSHVQRSRSMDNLSPEDQRAYYDAFVKRRNPDKLLDMKEYLVNRMGYMTAAQFDAKYLKKGKK